jgi:DNA-binding transcriptional ArsR family regulator
MYSFVTAHMTFITLVAISFIAGVLSIVLYMMLRNVKEYFFTTHKESINSLVSNYLAKSRYFEKELAQLHVRMDEIESQLNKDDKSGSKTITAVSSKPRDNIDITSHDDATQNGLENHSVTSEGHKPVIVSQSSLKGYNDITEYVLNLLIQKPLTSKELQHIIGRSREHTSRLLKKLFESELLYRDFSTRPFRYSITDEGRRWLEERPQVNERKWMDNDPRATKFEVSSEV